MPVVSVYRHGITAGIAPVSNHKRAKRGEIHGWSAGAVRRNLKFLYSIDERGLTGEGWAFTLTIRDCPPDPASWYSSIELWLLQVKRIMHTVRVHWVIEWQRRGVPHLHGAIWFPEGTQGGYDVENILIHSWIGHAARFRVSPNAQMVKPIQGVMGWFQYTAKHAARGAKHYQRSSENIPQTWSKTGRMWSHGGDWPIKEALKLGVENHAYYALRRMARAWRRSDARATHEQALAEVSSGSIAPRSLQKLLEARHRITSARTMLRCPKPELSRLRGISEWISEDLSLLMIQRLHEMGYSVTS